MADTKTDRPSPLTHAWHLLRPDLGDILVVFAFALVTALLSMATPLAVEALVNTVAFGRVLQPVVILSGFLFAFLGFQAAIRLLQVYVIELLQRRIFARAGADLAHRLPRIKYESLDSTDLPVLVNQFLDVSGVQKTAATLLLEGSSVLLNTLVGMAVLAFYHPWLLGFDLILLTAVAFILTVAGINAVNSAVKESKAKYRSQAWFEEMSHVPEVFRSTSGFSLGLDRANEVVSEYLKLRAKHFRILFRQNALILLLQAAASTVLLGIGGWLVITNRLTLGQLVAAELIVAIIVGAFAKLGKLLESYYDLLAASDKVGGLTELPEHTTGTVELPEGPLALDVVAVGYQFPSSPALFSNLSFTVEAGDSLALFGPNGSGKSVLCEIVAGLRHPGKGHVAIDGIDPHDIQPFTLHDCVILSQGHQLFDGTVLENIACGNPLIGVREAWEALEAVGLGDTVRRLPNILHESVSPQRNPFSSGHVRRLMLARAIAARPGMLIVDGLLDDMSHGDAADLVRELRNVDPPLTLIIATGRLEIAEQLPRIIQLPHNRAETPAS